MTDEHFAAVVNGIRQDCDCGVWDNACDEAGRREIHTPDGEETEAFADGAEWGAGWAFAIIGMAEAIRSRETRQIEERYKFLHGPSPLASSAMRRSREP